MQVKLKLSLSELADAIEMWINDTHDIESEIDRDRVELIQHQSDATKSDGVAVYYEM